MSISNYLENKLLDAVAGTSYSASNVYLKLHIGDPGEDGTSNPAAEDTRHEVTFAAAASGSMVSSAAVVWTNVSNAETYTHWSAWDEDGDPSSGNCLWTGALSSSATVAAGDTFQITSLTLTLD